MACVLFLSGLRCASSVCLNKLHRTVTMQHIILTCNWCLQKKRYLFDHTDKMDTINTPSNSTMFFYQGDFMVILSCNFTKSHLIQSLIRVQQLFSNFTWSFSCKNILGPNKIKKTWYNKGPFQNRSSGSSILFFLIMFHLAFPQILCC